MKKITALFALLMLVCMGAQAQITATLMEGYGEPLTLTQFKALAGTGQRFGFVASSNTAAANAPRCDHWCGFTNIHNTTTLSDDYLFYLEAVENDTCYKVKRASDNKYVITSTGSTTFGDDGFPFGLIHRDPNDATKAVTGEQSITFKNPNAGNWYNANAVKLNTGNGAWTTYAVFGPIYKNVTVDCQFNGASMDGYPQTFAYKAGTVEAPVFPGKKLAEGGPTSVTINADDMAITFNYEASTFDYTLVVNGAPEGTTITIKGETVSAGDVSFASEVTESDVIVNFPTEFAHYVKTVTISGTTITINCDDPRWPVNFDKSLRSTHASRYTDFVGLDDQKITIPGAAVGDLIYRDLTSETLTVAAGSTVTPTFGYRGWAMYGYLYIDYNDNGDFTDDGELVSQLPGNNWGSGNTADKTIPPFTVADAPGAHRARFKVEWNNTDPGGNANGSIAGNGGCMIDVTLVVSSAADVTYVVVDENNNELLRKTTTVGTGTVITTLPEAYQRSLFYDYNTVNETISGNTTLTFTATLKADAPFQFTADTSAPVWYYLKNQGNNQNPDGAYPTYVEGGDPNVTLPKANADDETTQWAFIGSPYAGFQIVNNAAGTSLVLGSAAAGNNDNSGGDTYATLAAPNSEPERREVWTIGASSYATNGFFIRNADGHALNLRSNANLAYWTGGADKGSTFVATKVPTPEEKYNALIEQLAYIPFGTGLGQYSLTYQGQDYTERAAEAINALMKAGYSEATMMAAQQILAGASLNMPKAGQFLRVKSVIGDNAYLKAGDAGETMTFSTTADESNIFCYYDSKLIAYQNGIAVNGIKSMGTVEGGEATTFTFKVGLNGTQSTYSLYGGENAVLYSTGTDGSNADWFNTSGSKDNTTFTLEEVTELPITLKEAQCKDGTPRWFATFSAPVAVSEVVGAEIHKVTDNGSTVKVEPAGVTGIPAGKAVLLVSETDPATLSVEPKVVLGETTDDFETVLSPLYVCEMGKAGLFFGKGGTSDLAGFYKLNPDTKTGGFKAYIADDGTGSAKVLDFGNEATGINTIENGAENGAVYNLQGQRVNKAQKGVFIQNGKKVVLK